MKILVVDDQAANRGMLSYILEDDGHEVLEAGDGEEGLDQFSQHEPDLVLMDVMMPGMDGYETARSMKAGAERHVPIIFLTALSDELSLSRCLEVGGDDFLTKPVNETLLHAKIRAHRRLRELNDELGRKNDELVALHDVLKQEHTLAEYVFEKALKQNLDSPHIHQYISPMTGFSGDMILTAAKPGGGIYAMLGDFTGHGLPAALGALPVSQAFHFLTGQGADFEHLVRHLNTVLNQYLPGHMFCASTLIELNQAADSARCWFGGLPDTFLLGPDGRIAEHFRSDHMPLGVLGSNEMECTIRTVALDPGSSFFVYSDGVTDCSNRAGDMFGDDRLEALFDGSVSGDRLFDHIRDSLLDYIRGRPQDDDVSMLAVRAALT